MGLKILFLGRLEDAAGAAEREIETDSPVDFGGILAKFPPDLAATCAEDRIRLALNGTLVDREALLAREGDEIAFLPPVSGG